MAELRYVWLDETLAVCRLGPNEPVPDWVPVEGFTTITRTTEELSIVCAEHACPEGIKAERGWAALKVLGPLPFDAVGILNQITGPMAQAGIPIIAIGTFDTDYVLVQRSQIATADTILAEAGLKLAR